jgi:hypothetical protein
MKRSYDNAMPGPATTAGQISTGQTATKESVYMNTNMVNIQREDHTSAHGIVSDFQQTRILPIVGKTSRAEIALKSADVQTKTLPIFQPQVALGQDIDRLIYESGVSATYRNSILVLPPDNTTISTLLYEGDVFDPVTGGSVFRSSDLLAEYYGVSTFTNDISARLPMIDVYNKVYDLTLFPTTVVNTQLDVLFDYWKSVIIQGTTSQLRRTCLTPVVVGSVSQLIERFQLIPNGVYEGDLLVSVKDTTDYKIGDRVRFFGSIQTASPSTPLSNVFGTVLDIVASDQQTSNDSSYLPALVIRYGFPGTSVIGTNFTYSPGTPFDGISTITFSLADTRAFTIGSFANIVCELNPQINGLHVVSQVTPGTVTIVYDIEAIVPTPSSPALFTLTSQGITPTLQDGYLINQRVQDGGHIEFLTDMYEFRPVDLQGTNQPTYTGTLQLAYNGSVPLVENSGFLRGKFTTGTNHEMSAAVQLTVKSVVGNDPTFLALYAKGYNGIYTVVASNPGNLNAFELAPLSIVLPTGAINLTDVMFTLSLAPNFYTMDTKADEIIELETESKLNFMRSLGYVPTLTLPVNQPTSPPTASRPTNTWLRAFQVDWDFSAYRNCQWVTQDTFSQKPRKPINQQDFGFDNGASTYYNVYEMNKFLNDCINPSIERCINDITYEIYDLEAFSLNMQLAAAHNAYKTLFTDLASEFVWSGFLTYLLGDLVVTSSNNGAWAFMATRTTTDVLPRTQTNSKSWYYLGVIPNQATNAIETYALTVEKTLLPADLRMMTMKILSGQPQTTYFGTLLSYNQISFPPNINQPSTNQLTFTPTFTTRAPTFHYNELTLLLSTKYDGYGFGTLNVNPSNKTQKQVSLYNYKRQSWGAQGFNNADENLIFESNTAFKFLLDNFPCYCTSYEDTLSELRSNGAKFPLISYWIWDTVSSVDPRVDTVPYEIYQTSESMSSCMSPVQSIVVVSDNIPVSEELSSPVNYLIDSESSSFSNRSDVTGLTQKIIGEIYLPFNTPFNVRSAVKYEADDLKFYALLDTKLFKQLEYSLYYRHRVAQQLVPLVLSNYGSVNIKFVFRPIS